MNEEVTSKEIKEERLSEEELDAKIEEAKKRILANKINSVKLVNSLYGYKLDEYKAKKARNRRRNKVQKLSRKKNR